MVRLDRYTKEEMVKTAEYWETESKREDLAKGYRAMAKRQAKAWWDNAKNPALYEPYTESGIDQEWQDRMNQEVRFK
jgi:hypothetical protein